MFADDFDPATALTSTACPRCHVLGLAETDTDTVKVTPQRTGIKARHIMSPQRPRSVSRLWPRDGVARLLRLRPRTVRAERQSKSASRVPRASGRRGGHGGIRFAGMYRRGSEKFAVELGAFLGLATSGCERYVCS